MKRIEQTARSEDFRASRFLWNPILVLLFLVQLTSCLGETTLEEEGIVELEGLAFVPRGATEINGGDSPRLDRALLVDRFEVTRDEWRDWLATAPLEGSEYPTEWLGESGSWPAVFMNLAEARAFSSWRGMRLATASEWFFVAMGPRAQDWPWDQYAAQAASNTQEVGLASPSPVGVFEQGQTPHGVYDLIGNVWEWVDGSLPASELAEGEFTWTAGGAFNSPRRELYLASSGFNAQLSHRGLRSSAVGLRCVVDAEEFLARYASEQPTSASEEDRFRAVGRRWGQSAVTVLTRLVTEEGSSLAFVLAGASQ